MLYAGNLVYPSSIRHAFKCHFHTPDLYSLIYTIHDAVITFVIDQSGGLTRAVRFKFNDAIEHINFYQKSDDATVTLLVLTSKLMVSTLKFCPIKKSIRPDSYPIFLHTNGSRLAEHLQTSIVDPHGRCVVIHALSGILHVLPLNPSNSSINEFNPAKRKKSNPTPTPTPTEPNNQPKDPTPPQGDLHLTFQIRLSELYVHGIAFADLPASYHPTLLILHSDHLGNLVLKYRKLDLETKVCDQEFSRYYTCRDPLTRLIIPTRTDDLQQGERIENSGAILIGGQSAELVCFAPRSLDHFTINDNQIDHKRRNRLNRHVVTLRAHTQLPLGVYTCFCKIDNLSHSWILGDLYGNLIFLQLERKSSRGEVSLRYRPLGHVPSPEALVYTSHERLFVASHYGDSQHLKLSSQNFSPDSNDSNPIPPQVIGSTINLGPISDFCITEDRTCRINQIVTCSGAYRDCSLRIVKRGFGLTDISSVAIGGVQRVWTLKSPASHPNFDDRILLSSAYHTIILAFNRDGTIEELKHFNGFRTDTPSILAGNLTDSSLSHHRYSVQVTPHQVIAGENLWWNVKDEEILTGAAMGPSKCIVSLKRQVLILCIRNGSIVTVVSHDFQNDISSVAIDPYERFVAVAQWITNVVQIVSTLVQNKKGLVRTGSQSMINSLAMTYDEGHGSGECKLFIGFSNSQVVHYRLDPSGQLVRNQCTRTYTMGTTPIQFEPMFITSPDKSYRGIWVNSDQPALISQSMNDGRVVYFPIIARGGRVLSATRLDSPLGFPNLVILAYEKEIRFAQLNLSSSYINKIPLGVEQPRRITHSPSIKTYGVLCVRSEIHCLPTLDPTGSLKIFDDTNFKCLHTFPLLPSEQGLSIMVLKLGNDGLEKFVIGTGTIEPNETESKVGRILVIGERKEENTTTPTGRSFELLASMVSPGPVGGLGALPNGMFVACIDGFLHAYAIKEEVESPGGRRVTKMELLDSWGNGFLSANVVTNGNEVLVADDCKGIVLLEFHPDQLRFALLAKDFNETSVRRMGILSSSHRDDEFIATDHYSNLFTLTRDRGPGCSQHRDQTRNDDIDDDEEENADSEFYTRDWLDQLKFMNSISSRDLTPLGSVSRAAGIYLGQTINQFRPGSLIPKSMESNSIFQPKSIFVTSTGGIGMIMKLKISKQHAQLLADSETVLSNHIMKTFKFTDCIETELLTNEILLRQPTTIIFNEERLGRRLNSLQKTHRIPTYFLFHHDQYPSSLFPNINTTIYMVKTLHQFQLQAIPAPLNSDPPLYYAIRHLEDLILSFQFIM